MHQNRKDEHYVHAYYSDYFYSMNFSEKCMCKYQVEDENGGEFHKKVLYQGFFIIINYFF